MSPAGGTQHISKNKSAMKQILLSLLLVASAACSKNNDGPAPQQENPFSLNVEYENRAYNPGETIDLTLTVEETTANEDHFLFAPVFYGKGTITLEGEPIGWKKEQQIPYGIINSSRSSATLHFTVAPEFSDWAKNEYSLRFFVSRPDGSHKTYREVKLKTQNTAPITAQIISTGESHIKLDDTYAFEWSASKEGYTGNFKVETDISEGDGFFLDPDEDNRTIWFLEMPSNTTKKIKYQPLKAGIHKFTLTISDSMSKTVLEGSVEVMPESDGPESGLMNPDPGIYIYADSRYYLRSKWKKEWGLKAEGVAIVSSQSTFLLAPAHKSGKWAYPPKDDNTDKADYMSIMPELTWTMDYSTAKADFDGYKNTKALVDADSKGLIQAPIAKLCYNYDPEQPGKWYMPAAGQLYLIYENFEEVQACLKKIGARGFEYEYWNEYYCSSTGCNNSYIFALKCNSSGTSVFGTHWIYPTHSYKTFPVQTLTF